MKPLSSEHINQYTHRHYPITVLSSCDSTNTTLKKLAAKQAEPFTLLITEHQTAGKGRLGKTFFSPQGCGLYFSLLLRPDIAADQAVLVTVAAAVAVKRAVEKLLSLSVNIKWVNDIYVSNKKFCGILTEAALTPQGTVSYAVLGIGINLFPPEDGYPEEFAFKTTNLTEAAGQFPTDFKNKLVAEILNYFHAFYENLEDKAYLEEYKNASCVIGKDIEILSGLYAGKAHAVDIDENANLIVLLPNGSKTSLSSGDVSIHI